MKNILLKPLNNEKGLALILAVLILTVLTVAAMSSIISTRLQVRSSGTDKVYKETFYAADAGLEYAKEQLRHEFLNANGSWSNVIGSAGSTYQDGIVYDSNVTLGSGLYEKNFDIIIWKGKDFVNTNYMWVRIEAYDAEGIEAAVENMLYPEPGARLPLSYHSQEGAGSSKHSTEVEYAKVQMTSTTF
jgi:Tfp pilus assembly protein PilX